MPRGKSAVPFAQVIGRASESVWTLWRKDLLPLSGSEPRFLERSSRSLVTIPTEISRLLALRLSCPRKKREKTWGSSINTQMLFGCDYVCFDRNSLLCEISRNFCRTTQSHIYRHRCQNLKSVSFVYVLTYHNMFLLNANNPFCLTIFDLHVRHSGLNLFRNSPIWPPANIIVHPCPETCFIGRRSPFMYSSHCLYILLMGFEVF